MTEGLHKVFVDKNSLKNFWREARKHGFDFKKDLSTRSIRAQSELFQKYFKISLTLLDTKERETSSFEETLKNIELKTKNIVRIEEPQQPQSATKRIKKRKIKMEPVEILQKNNLIEEAVVVDQDNVKEEEVEGPKHQAPCSNSSCNEEVCKRFSMKLEVPEDVSQSELAFNLKIDECDVKPEWIKDESLKVSNLSRKDITVCSECGFKAASFWILKVHMEMIHLLMRWICNLCDYNTKEKYILRKHIRNNHSQDFKEEYMSYECGNCSTNGPMIAAASGSCFVDHISSRHPSMLIFYQSAEKTEKVSHQCRFCGQSCESLTLYNSHLEQTHMSLEYTCLVCDYMVTSKLNIRKHIRTFHCPPDQAAENSRECKRFVRENFSRVCSYCRKHLPPREDLESHITVNHPDKTSKRRKTVKDPAKLVHCDSCDFTSSLTGSLRSHVMSRHLKAQFECQNCHFQSKSLPVLKKHIKTDHTEEEKSAMIKASCGTCEVSSASLREFQQHVRENHSQYSRQTRPQRKLRKKKKKKEDKRIKHDKLPTFLCQNCNISTKAKEEIIEHVIEKHDIDEEEDSEEQFEAIIRKITVQCVGCGFCGSFTDYTAHLTTQSSVVCGLCGSHNKDEKELADHVLLTHRGCGYVCSDCDYGHHTRRAVVLHYREVHGGSRTRSSSRLYQCPLCPLKASEARMTDHWQEEHQAVETECKTGLLQCQYCVFKHISPAKLENHLGLTHKIFNCSDCSETFNKRKLLVTHIFRNHRSITFDCEKCDFKTKHESALYRHTNSIHGKVEPIPCGECNKQFNRKDNLAVHVRKVHVK